MIESKERDWGDRLADAAVWSLRVSEQMADQLDRLSGYRVFNPISGPFAHYPRRVHHAMTDLFNDRYVPRSGDRIQEQSGDYELELIRLSRFKGVYVSRDGYYAMARYHASRFLDGVTFGIPFHQNHRPFSLDARDLIRNPSLREPVSEAYHLIHQVLTQRLNNQEICLEQRSVSDCSLPSVHGRNTELNNREANFVWDILRNIRSSSNDQIDAEII